MSNVVLLSKEVHRDLKLKRNKNAFLAHGVSICATFPIEFRDVQAHYPIFFQKTMDKDEYAPMALLGLEPKENLFVSEAGWDCSYIPLAMDVQPFVIGRSSRDDGQGNVFIDMDSPLIADSDDTDGVRIFEETGTESEYLKAVVHDMEKLHFGFETSKDYVEWLLRYDLLEPFVLDVELKDKSINRLTGFQTINEDRLKELEDDLLLEMRKKGYLMPTYMALASLTSIAGLIERKNAKTGE